MLIIPYTWSDLAFSFFLFLLFLIRSKNPVQITKKRSRLIDSDNETAIDFSQLFISPTSPTTTNTSPDPSVPTTTTTVTASAAAAAAKMVLSDSVQNNIRDYYYYYPPRWTATSLSLGVGEGGGGRAKLRADGPRPSWPPSHRIHNSGYYYP